MADICVGEKLNGGYPAAEEALVAALALRALALMSEVLAPCRGTAPAASRRSDASAKSPARSPEPAASLWKRDAASAFFRRPSANLSPKCLSFTSWNRRPRCLRLSLSLREIRSTLMSSTSWMSSVAFWPE
jgi:hypothetical protein